MAAQFGSITCYIGCRRFLEQEGGWGPWGAMVVCSTLVFALLAEDRARYQAKALGRNRTCTA